MDIYVNIKPLERLQTLLIKKDNGETIQHFVFLEDVPAAILNDYKQKDASETCVIRLRGNAEFNRKYKDLINEYFIKEYGSADYIIIM